MRPKLSTLGLLLLVVAVGLMALTGCSRQAQVREEQSSEQASTEQTSGEESPTTEALAVQGSESVAPMPGETVVSAVPPTLAPNTPVAAEQASSPTAVEQLPTAEPATPTQPAASPTATEAATAAATGAQDTITSGEGQLIIHEVKKGETLSEIAERYGTTTQAIITANSLSDPSNIIPGQELKIQASGDSASESSASGDSDAPVCRKTHKVKRGEWVWKIAEKYDVPPKEIMVANNLTSKKARMLQPGTVLCIP